MTTGSRKNQTEIEVKPNGFTDERILERLPEDTRRSPVQIRAAPPNPKILNVLVNLEANNKSKSVLRNTRKYLTSLSKEANLENPEEVKEAIKNRKVSDGMKRILCYAYQRYADYYKIEWKKPKYTAKSREVKIPTKQKIEKLIASAHAPLNLKLQISYEDGLRPIELYTLRPKDIDFEQRKLYPETAKNGSSRFLPISVQLKGMLETYIQQHNTKPDEYLFKGNQTQYSQSFRELRNRLAKRLNDPSYKNIKLYDLRHYFGTTMFAELGNLRIVQKLMGHKHITTTEIYEHLTLMETDPKFTTRTTQTTEEDNQAIADRFEYITERNTFKMWRKRKF